MEDTTGCRVAQVSVAKVRILKGACKGRYTDMHGDDVAHFPLAVARRLEAKGEVKILEVLEPGMPPGGNK
jgi:hypothetical protein